ncbi:hypothetical protein I5G58_gp011 [Mycobacterium phage BirdsNest]|uniref:DUF1360 domain-containing protein n=1 Tax=Mycobacterium phage BirdsNest TaxID=2686231 RepID=A0A6B9L9A8_9CAUD|nr:hypothetical protein I5G58_gp011 [Mycobacterium phage BirdsNest]QHB37313.1 hypothetical protein PBI_BIRDSNEST_11 [Mycobacterium phage BirdsNest]
MNISTGHAVLVLVIFVLAIARLTRIINADKIADPIRLWPAGKVREATLAGHEARAHGRSAEAAVYARRQQRWATAFEFVQCPWCVGWWFALAGAIVPVWFIGWPWWAMFPVALATSHLVGVLARFADTDEIDIEDAAADAQ